MFQDYYNMYNQLYGSFEPNYRASDLGQGNDEIISLNQAILLIRQSVGNEKDDELFYDCLIKQAPTEKEKDIIKSIRNDEQKHNGILRKLYYDFTGQMIPQDMNVVNPSNITTSSSDMNKINEQCKFDYKANLEKALFGELNAVSKYRKILGTMPSGNPYTLIMSILTDELRHASKYNFLIHIAS